jgi:hypothetical protein
VAGRSTRSLDVMRGILIAMCAVIATQGHAKCVDVDISVSGTILDFDQRPVGGATVVISFVEVGEARSVVTYSKDNGDYFVSFAWYPWRESRWFEWRGDRCDGTLESISLRVIAPGYDQTEDRSRVSNQRVEKDIRLKVRT